jgi:AAA+ ATPase superfamily predicted ATPase
LEKEIEDLLHHGRNGDHVLLLSPRRHGKTSLVRRTLDQLAEEGYLTVYKPLALESTALPY